MSARSWKILGAVLGHVLFWCWNLLFLSILWMGFGPVILLELVVASLGGVVPLSFAIFGTILVLLPAASMLVGFLRLRDDPGRLLSLLYGVQFPLMVLCLLRIFAIQQLTWATGLALAAIAVGALGLLRTLLHGFEERHPAATWLRLVAQSVYLVVGLWWAIVSGIYGLGFFAGITTKLLAGIGNLTLGAWSGVSLEGLLFLLWLLPWVTFMALTVVMLAIFPVALVGISIRSWSVVARASHRRLGPGIVAATTAAVVIGLSLAFAATTRQPQHHARATLEAIETDADRQAALDDSAAIRRGLLAATLSSERWIDGDLEGEHVHDLWSASVGEGLAVLPQGLWRIVMSPFLYQRTTEPSSSWVGVGEERQWAEAQYGQFFDRPMRRAERDVLVEAARQTWSWRDAAAGLLDVGERRVHLDRQEVVVEPHGDWARVTIHDVYRNHTPERQEVSLHFSLPQTAAVTGLWLGPDDDRGTAFTHVVAPRGAAQEVYTSEVQRRVDPALLESVGPQQYRLRAFPVEPRSGLDVWSLADEGPELHLWLELIVPRRGDGADAHWPLPVAREARNLFWDEQTEREQTADSWLPSRIPAVDALRREQAAVVGGLSVRAVPVGPTPARGARPGQRLGVLVDGSRSMAAHRRSLAEALGTLGASASLEVFCTRQDTVGRCDQLDPDAALFWGARPLEEQIAALEPGSVEVDAWVVLTDEGSYELSSVNLWLLRDWPSDQPLWLLHLGDAMPIAYTDVLLDVLSRTGGGVADAAPELVAQLADPDVRDGYRWIVEPTDQPDSEGLFAAVAARVAVTRLDRQAPAGSLAHLDQVHAIAVEHGVVTPYSSMIVLVNDRQRQALDAAEQRDDRFEREVETGGGPPVVSSAPEPGTWLLLGLGGALMWAGRHRRIDPADDADPTDQPRVG